MKRLATINILATIKRLVTIVEVGNNILLSFRGTYIVLLLHKNLL